jgi:hypothetical protein
MTVSTNISVKCSNDGYKVAVNPITGQNSDYWRVQTRDNIHVYEVCMGATRVDQGCSETGGGC